MIIITSHEEFHTFENGLTCLQSAFSKHRVEIIQPNNKNNITCGQK